jgi:hypothetical protein
MATLQPAAHRLPRREASAGWAGTISSALEVQSLMTPTSQRMTRTMMITPTIPMPPDLFISISV